MKKVTLFLFAANLLSSCILAWDTPREDFSEDLKLEVPVTSTRNPWGKIELENERLEVRLDCGVRDGWQEISVSLQAMHVFTGSPYRVGRT